MIISTYNNAFDTQPKILQFEGFDSLVKHLESSIETLDPPPLDPKQPQKKPPKPSGLKLFSAVNCWSTPRRANKNVVSHTNIFALDFDHCTPGDFDKIIIKARELDLRYYLYSSFNNEKKGPEDYSFRILIELKTGFKKEGYKPLWQALNSLFFSLVDEQTQAPAQMFYYPVRNAERPDSFYSEYYDKGQPLDWESLIPAAPPEPAEPERPEIPLTELLAFLNKRAKSQSKKPGIADTKHIAKYALKIIEGKVPKDLQPGKASRHAFMLSLSGMLATRYPDADPKALAELFNQHQKNGWYLFAAGDPKNHGTRRFAGMIRDFQNSEQQKKDKQLERRLKNISGELITQEQLSELKEIFGENWESFFCLHYKSGYLFLKPDATVLSRAFTATEVLLVVRDHHALFGDAIKYYYPDPDTGEEKRISLDRFRELYCSVIHDLEYRQDIDRTAFDRDTRKLSVACARPVVSPVYHQDVQDWLLSIGGELLCDWVCGATRLNEMLPALILTGPGGSGKTLLAHGLGMIYGKPPLIGADVHTRFNHDLKDQPIVLHDEKAGKAYDESGTSLIREFTTAGDRYIEQKFQDKIRLVGFPRLIFCANNVHILDTSENMSKGDREAFAQRLLHFEFKKEHTHYLKENLDRTQKYWLKQKHLPEHLLWLGKNWQVKNRGQRFLVATPMTRLHRVLAGGAGTGAEVIQVLLDYVADTNRHKIKVPKADCPILIVRGQKPKFYATTRSIVYLWPRYFGDQSRVPPRSVITRALESVSRDTKVRLEIDGPSDKDARRKFYDIEIEQLRANLDRHELTEDDFDAAFK